MDGALQYRRPLDNNIWLKDAREDVWRPRRKQPRPAVPSKDTVGALLRAAYALTEREDLTEAADALACFMDVGVEQLYAMPLAEFVERYESTQLTREINEVYDEELEEEDEEFLAHVKNYQGRVLTDTGD